MVCARGIARFCEGRAGSCAPRRGTVPPLALSKMRTFSKSGRKMRHGATGLSHENQRDERDVIRRSSGRQWSCAQIALCGARRGALERAPPREQGPETDVEFCGRLHVARCKLSRKRALCQKEDERDQKGENGRIWSQDRKSVV